MEISSLSVPMEISSITAQAQWKFPASVDGNFQPQCPDGNFQYHCSGPMEISSVIAHKAGGNFQRHCSPSRWKFPASLLRPEGNFQHHCSGPMEISSITAPGPMEISSITAPGPMEISSVTAQARWKFPASLLRPPQREFYSIICCKPNNEQKSKSNSWVCLCHVGVGKLGPGGHWELDLIVKTWVGEIRR